MINQIKADVVRIIKELLELPEDIMLDNRITDNGVNSIIFIKLIVALESAYEIEIPDEFLVMEKFETIDDFVNCIASIRKSS
ncbi:acyl carrier protein [Paenibacillus macquariensis]|uniref:Acyl carrier protein n=1 Tax=Paenibacillus macquariensis TaxID=948756 RepID=A0ABY1K2K9_9BACL|nr:phosphopantetheine-binding protein [Paenibacillus macquariensis]MEC0090205.1 phosphopantetheine-binding protein [Paenibacillus macquariensis]OAB39577.1 hypothetical protein PMSM_00130 [Paenibacillus macquariensis subsp. macquariensis]SIR17347.1 acyl carrier protein [Paenibacillus macquariensis]